MANYNIQMEYFNGDSYDQLYPQVDLSNTTGSLPISNTSGTLEISRGGTGSTTANEALGNLINNSSITDTLIDSNYLGIFNNNSGRKMSLLTLKNYITNNLSGLNAYHLSSTMQASGTGSSLDDYAYFNFTYSGSYNLAIALSFFSAAAGGSPRYDWSFVWFMVKKGVRGIYCGSSQDIVYVSNGTFNSTSVYGRIMAGQHSGVYIGKKVDLFMF